MSKMSERLALHTWSLDTTPLREALAAARAGGFDAVELRRVDFTRCFEKGMSNDEVLALVRDSGVKVAVLGTESGFVFGNADETRRLFGVLEETCRNAQALGCEMIMTAPGAGSGTLKQAAAALRAAGEIVGQYGLRMAVEFNTSHEVLNRLEIAREVIALANHRSVGVLLDAYHMERTGSGGRGFADLAPEEIFAFQYSDVPRSDPSGAARPTDRLIPGQGRIPWKDVFGLLAEKRYAGHLSYEGPNPALWARPPAELAREVAAATRRLLAEVE